MHDDVNDYARARVGKTIKGKYKLERLIGCGGMAAVYEAVHRNGHRVAIKMLHPHLSLQSDLPKRFLREGYFANMVNHRGAVRVTDDDVTEDGSVFLVMELLEGETLDGRWGRCGRRLPLPEVCALAGELLDVLAAAHAKGLVHRDIKPENVFLTSDGVLKVLDFGIARLQEATLPEGATRTGRMIGTPAFMPPEQALGRQRQIDGQTDLWAVGATMFTLASGRFVHEAETFEEMLVHAGSRPARPIATLVPDVPPTVAAVIDRALAFKKEDRWPDARAMQAALAQAIADAYGAAGRRPSADADPYAPTAAALVAPTVTEGTAMGVAQTERWTAAAQAGLGISTTAGTARASWQAPETTRGPRRRTFTLVASGGVVLTLLGGGAAAVHLLRANPLDRKELPPLGTTLATQAQVVQVPPTPTVVPTTEPTPAGPPPAGNPTTGVPDAIASPMARPPSTAPPNVAHPRPTPAAAPTPVAPAATATPPAETPSTPAPPPVVTSPSAPAATAPPGPTCRAVPYFDSDGNKRFKQVCR